MKLRPGILCATLAAALGATLLSACVVEAPAPVMTPSTYDRSYTAIVAAMSDQNVRITSEDRISGVVTGVKGGITVTATVQRQADGSARLDFKTRGAIDEDPRLIDRIAASYNARMGR